MNGENGQPSSCPHIGIVCAYEFAMREKIHAKLSEGIYIDVAFENVMADVNLRNTAFLSLFTTEHTSARCRALTAPAFREIHGHGGSSGSRREDTQLATGIKVKLSKGQKRAVAKAKAAALLKALGHTGGREGRVPDKGLAAPPPPRLAITNGEERPKKRAKGEGKGKTKNEATGKGICFAFNNGTKCKFDPCPFDHVCQTCGGKHPKTDPTCPGK